MSCFAKESDKIDVAGMLYRDLRTVLNTPAVRNATSCTCTNGHANETPTVPTIPNTIATSARECPCLRVSNNDDCPASNVVADTKRNARITKCFSWNYILVCTCICLLYITKVTAGAPTPRMSSTKWYMQPFGNGSDEQKGYTEHSEYSKRNTLNELILQCALQISENRPEVFVKLFGFVSSKSYEDFKRETDYLNLSEKIVQQKNFNENITQKYIEQFEQLKRESVLFDYVKKDFPRRYKRIQIKAVALDVLLMNDDNFENKNLVLIDQQRMFLEKEQTFMKRTMMDFEDFMGVWDIKKESFTETDAHAAQTLLKQGNNYRNWIIYREIVNEIEDTENYFRAFQNVYEYSA